LGFCSWVCDSRALNVADFFFFFFDFFFLPKALGLYF
jgi:hypothetical protein